MSNDSVGVALVPLYSDERIERAVGAADFHHYEDELAENLMRDMRDDYERDRNFWAAERQQDKARIDALQAQAEQYVQKNDHLHSTCTEFAERIHDLERQLDEADAVSDEVREAIQTILDAASVEDVVYTFDARMKVIKWLDTLTGAGRVTMLEKKLLGCQRELNEAEQILGKALGFPWYKDDPTNFPDATDADGVCVGEHTVVTLAMEAARRLTRQHNGATGVDEGGLRPCPFCGKPATLKRLNAYYFTVECAETCRCSLPGFLSKERAIAAWNMRVEPAAAPVPTPDDVLNAIEELDNLAGEAIPYAGEYFDDKWALSERYNAARSTVYAWLEQQHQRDAEGGSD